VVRLLFRYEDVELLASDVQPVMMRRAVFLMSVVFEGSCQILWETRCCYHILRQDILLFCM